MKLLKKWRRGNLFLETCLVKLKIHVYDNLFSGIFPGIYYFPHWYPGNVPPENSRSQHNRAEFAFLKREE